MNVSYNNKTLEKLQCPLEFLLFLYTQNPETLVKSADEPLYEAKHTGRNRVVIAQKVKQRKGQKAVKPAEEFELKKVAQA